MNPVVAWVGVIVAVAAAIVGPFVYGRFRRARAARARADGHLVVPRLAPGDRHLLLLMLDGLPVATFEEALAGGALPNLARLFATRPNLHMHAIATFPSATAPSLPELLAGRYVDLEQLPAPGAVHAFDRERRRVVRYVTEPDAWSWPLPNLFDTVHAAGLSATTVFEGRWENPESISTAAALTRAAARELIGAGELASSDRGPVHTLLARIERNGPPRVTLVVFNEIDMKGHFHGPGSPQVRQALIATDGLVGEIVERYRGHRTAAGTSVLDETTILLFGDHGMVASGRFLDLAGFLEQRGLTVYDASTATHVVLRERLGTLWTHWPDAILVSGGSNITQIYLRDADGGWLAHAAVDEREKLAHPRPDLGALAGALTQLPGVGQVLRQLVDGTIEVLAGEGRRARIVQRERAAGRSWAYVVDDDAVSDPFGYIEDPRAAPLVARASQLHDTAFRGADEWMLGTLHSRFPGAVPLVPKAFHPQRFTGDLMVTTLPGWSFLRSQRGDHGNLERDAVLTPFVVNGPGIEHARAPELVRLVDVFPTAAVLLGAAPDDPALARIDGRPLPGVRGP